VVFLGARGKFILVVILFTNEDKSEAFDKQVLTSVCAVIRICYIYPPVINLGIYPLTWWGEKEK
jgi:hypothetical protein